MMRKQAFIAMALAFFVSAVCAQQSGRELIESSLRQHGLPDHVYQEQVLILTDRHGNTSLRTVHFYSFRDPAGTRMLWKIETPADAKGAMAYVSRDADGGARHGTQPSSSLFGSSFAVADLETEHPDDFRYEPDGEEDLDRVAHHVLRTLPADPSVTATTGYRERRIYLRKDNLFISRIDYLDREGKAAKRQTFRDPRADEAGGWQPGMILMEDLRGGGRALIKIERRVHSSDYVPASLFAGRAR